MNSILVLFLAIIGAGLYKNNKFIPFLFIALIISNSGFEILPFMFPNGSRWCYDGLTVMCLIVLIVQFKKRKQNSRYRSDEIGRILIIIILYIFVRTLFSVFLGEEYISYALKQFRLELVMLLYFVVKQVDNISFRLFFRKLIVVYVVVGILFSISFIINMSSGFSEEIFNHKTIIAMSGPMLMLMLFTDLGYTKIQRLWLIVFFAFLLFASFSRGIIIAFGVALGYYYVVIKRNYKSVLIFLVFLPAFLYIFSYVDKSKSDNISNASTSEEIRDVMSLDSYSDFHGGSFALRVGLCWEKLDYLWQNPSILLWGVGTIHEDSPKNNFNFMIGSFKMTDNARTRQQIDTADVAFISHIFRFGLVWFVLFILFLGICVKKSMRRITEPYMITTCLTIIMIIIAGLSTDYFSYISYFFIPLLLISRIMQPIHTNIGAKLIEC